jgi:hypothetical protein
MNENFTVVDAEIGSLRDDVNNSLTHIGITAPVDTDRFWLDITGRLPLLRYHNSTDWVKIASLEAGEIQLSEGVALILGDATVEAALVSIKEQSDLFIADFIAVNGRIDGLTTRVDGLSLNVGLTLIVDPTNVNAPFKTIQSAIDSLPKQLNKDVVVRVDALTSWTEDIVLEGFFGSGKITVDASSRARVVTGVVFVRHCSCQIIFTNIYIKGVDKGVSDATFTVLNSNYVLMTNVQFDANSLNTYGLAVSGSFVQINTSIIQNAAQYAINTTTGTRLEIINVYGSNVGGVRADGAVHIGGSGKAPLGTTGGTNLVLVNGATCTVPFTHSAT